MKRNNLNKISIFHLKKYSQIARNLRYTPSHERVKIIIHMLSLRKVSKDQIKANIAKE